MPICYYFHSVGPRTILNLISESDSLSQISTGDAASTAAAQYPRERIPKLPVLSLATFTKYSAPQIPSVYSAGAAYSVRRGCMALGLALQHAHVREGDDVLLPAYHCISMVEPVVWHGARPVFYRVNADTSVNFEDLETQLTKNTRVVLAAHYFGFPQQISRLRSFCDAHRLILIEDCAHAYFGSIDDKPVGSFGDYAIASTWKFFPVSEGGMLLSARRDLTDLNLQPPGPWHQVKALVNTIEQAHEFKRMPIAGMLLQGAMALKERFHAGRRRGAPVPAEAGHVPGTTLNNWGFDASDVDKKMAVALKLIAALASKQRIVRNRRQNYLKLLAELGNIEGSKPLFNALNDGVVPQVFPLFVREPERVFGQLKHQGVPIIRFGEFLWPEMPTTRCPTSRELSRCVFQFPCHQDLKPAELDWMIGCIRNVFGAGRCDKSPAPHPTEDVRIAR